MWGATGICQKLTIGARKERPVRADFRTTRFSSQLAVVLENVPRKVGVSWAAIEAIFRQMTISSHFVFVATQRGVLQGSAAEEQNALLV